jgi:hypothetical protein
VTRDFEQVVPSSPKLVEQLRQLEDSAQDDGRLDDMVILNLFVSNLEGRIKRKVDAPCVHDFVCECERCPHCGEVIEDY